MTGWRARPPTAADVEALVDCLTGAAISQQDLLAEVAEHEAACDLLTRDQADVLDRLKLLNRVEIRGGAGSGKTWLALEKRGGWPTRSSASR